MKLLVSDAGTRPNSNIQIQYRPLPLAVQPAALLSYLRQTEGDILQLCNSDILVRDHDSGQRRAAFMREVVPMSNTGGIWPGGGHERPGTCGSAKWKI